MAVRDNVTLNNILLAFEGNITTDTTTTGAIIDTANQDLGVSFWIGASAYTDGTYKLILEEGDDSGLSDATTVPAEKLIEVSGLDAVTTGVTAITADGDKYFKVGVFSTKRFVRPSVVSTATSTGAQISVLALVSPEILEAN